ncbi:MAG: hypothetical protein LBJ71_05410 [Holosporaceae bacterium]|nr:hypothetical protein [Holosporaceae bacterium]
MNTMIGAIAVSALMFDGCEAMVIHYPHNPLNPAMVAREDNGVMGMAREHVAAPQQGAKYIPHADGILGEINVVKNAYTALLRAAGATSDLGGLDVLVNHRTPNVVYAPAANDGPPHALGSGGDAIGMYTSVAALLNAKRVADATNAGGVEAIPFLAASADALFNITDNAPEGDHNGNVSKFSAFLLGEGLPLHEKTAAETVGVNRAAHANAAHKTAAVKQIVALTGFVRDTHIAGALSNYVAKNPKLFSGENVPAAIRVAADITAANAAGANKNFLVALLYQLVILCERGGVDSSWGNIIAIDDHGDCRIGYTPMAIAAVGTLINAICE